MLRSAGFPQRLKPHPLRNLFGTAETVPFYRAMPPFSKCCGLWESPSNIEFGYGTKERLLRVVWDSMLGWWTLVIPMSRRRDTGHPAGERWWFPCLRIETWGTHVFSN